MAQVILVRTVARPLATNVRPMTALAAKVSIVEVDPLGPEALALLREAAVEARTLYPAITGSDVSWPSNEPIPARGVYLIARSDGRAVACGALRPISVNIAEVCRVFVTSAARRHGLAIALLRALESHAARLSYETMWLETGDRQPNAIALYEKYGFKRMQSFGEHIDDPTSICFSKPVQAPNETRRFDQADHGDMAR
jgi:putative acetyltransferase